MAGGNPVFDRLNKQIEQERYAGFGTGQQNQQGGAQQGLNQASAGYAGQDATTAQQLNEMYARDRPDRSTPAGSPSTTSSSRA